MAFWAALPLSGQISRHQILQILTSSGAKRFGSLRDQAINLR